MKIAFLCGALEQGCDGVGDYARRLADACVQKGHSVALISISDHWVTEPKLIEGSIPMLRLPQALTEEAQEAIIKDFLADFNPDFLSLQFVCYSFNPKGLCWNLSSFLKRLKGSIPLHIMAHELWIGPHDYAPLKEKLIGNIQKHFIRAVLKQAQWIQTHSPAYQYLLKKEGFESHLLPLFSNIPIASGNSDACLLKLLQEQGVHIQQETRGDFWIFGFFGSIYRNFSPEPLFSLIAESAKKSHKKAICLSIGHLGASTGIWERLEKEMPHGLIFSKANPASLNDLSLALQSLDYGIATTPLSLIEKSGSAAVLKAHGIPTLICRNDVHFAGFSHNEPTTEFRLIEEKLPEILPLWKKFKPEDNLPHIADLFLKQLHHE